MTSPTHNFTAPTWTKRTFEFVLLACIGFVFLTALAMAWYPGGTARDHDSRGYQFFVNYFSDLGRTSTYNGTPNGVSSALFTLALGAAGLALSLFFVAFARLFWRGLFERVAAGFGAALGLLSGAAFAGIAVTPANLNSPLHLVFVSTAFRAFLLAVLPFIIVILSGRHYPRGGALVFIAFALGLVAYIQLITVGPSPRTLPGLMVQATGQKLIVYASIVSVGLQALLARRFCASQTTSTS
jgi:hypothetical membrane protein